MIRATIKKIRKTIKNENIDNEFIKNIDQLIENYPSHTLELLVLKAQSIQLLDSNDLEFTLENAKECLKKALEIDPSYIDALMELCYFEWHVQDNAAKTVKYAIKIAKKAVKHTKNAISLLNDARKDINIHGEHDADKSK